MSQNVTPEMVRHIARLSRIELTADQLQTLGPQLAEILEYFDKLQELDTTAVTPMAHAVELTNVLDEDVVQPSLAPDEALANAPQRDGNLFMVPKVIGDS